MKRKIYSSDLTNEEWILLSDFMPVAKSGGRPRTIEPREILNSIFYILRAGCAWRLLPHDFPNWKTVYHYYWREWRTTGLWERINAMLRQILRRNMGRAPEPSAAVIDSQASENNRTRRHSRLRTAARKSLDENGICWLTRSVCCSKRKFMLEIF